MSDHEDMLKKYFVQAQEQPSLLSRNEAQNLLLQAGKNPLNNQRKANSRSVIATLAVCVAAVAIVSFLSINNRSIPAGLELAEAVGATDALTVLPLGSDREQAERTSLPTPQAELGVSTTQQAGNQAAQGSQIESHQSSITARVESVHDQLSVPTFSAHDLAALVQQNNQFSYAANFSAIEPPSATRALDYTVAGTQITPLAETRHLSERVVISKLESVNTPYNDDYNPMISPDGRTLYFISTREHGLGGHDFWMATKKHREDVQFSQPRNLGSGINTPGDEGTASISGDGQVMYFAGCGRPDGLGDCDIYEAQFGEEGWTVVRNVREINSSYWDTQPTVSADGRSLYFISNRPGALGGHEDADIYVSSKNADGTWSTPKNLGAPVNTKKKEDSPFIAPGGNTLYFSSAGHKGMGKLDFFVSYKQKNGSWGTPENLGPAFNTPQDERFITLPAAEDIVYFASSDGSKGLDLFMGRRDARSSSVVINGSVIQQKTNQHLNARLLFVDGITGEVLAGTSTNDETGEYSFVLGQHTARRVIHIYGITDSNQEFRAQISLPSANSYLVYQCNLILQEAQPDYITHAAQWSPGLPTTVGSRPDIITLDVSENAGNHLTVLDAWGHMLVNRQLNGNTSQETLDFSGMPNGLYLARVGNRTGIISIDRSARIQKGGS